MSACVFPQLGHFSCPVSGLNCIPAPQLEQENCSLAVDAGMEAGILLVVVGTIFLRRTL